jgi:hypothetical protein
MYGPPSAHQATGVFSDAARSIVAEKALSYAYRADHRQIGADHLLLANLGRARETIVFDLLIRILTIEFRTWLPPGWTIYGSARSDGFSLSVPDSRSEEGYRIHMGWIVGSAQSGRRRVLDVTEHALTSLQRAVAETTQTDWPAETVTGTAPEPHAEIGGDDINPTLLLWYGSMDAPILALKRPILLNMVLHG